MERSTDSFPGAAEVTEASDRVIVFGPHYPPALQRVVNHAERIADLLATPELSAGGEPWVVGRSEEIASYVGVVAADWRAGMTTEDAAAVTIGRYLVELHDGLSLHFGIRQPRCCNTTDAV